VKYTLFFSGLALLSVMTMASTLDYKAPTLNEVIDYTLVKKDKDGKIVLSTDLVSIVGYELPFAISKTTSDPDGVCNVDVKTIVGDFTSINQTTIDEFPPSGDYAIVLPLKKNVDSVETLFTFKEVTYQPVGDQTQVTDTCIVTNSVSSTHKIKWHGLLKFGETVDIPLDNGTIFSITAINKVHEKR
jgi:hypothetical protein